MDERPEREPDDEPPATGAAGQRLAAAKPMLRIKNWARALRRDAHAIRLASRDPRVPWTVKLLAIAVAGYALSPIDLIPDFIPVLGYLDDLIIVPLGIWLVIALIPEDVMREYRAMASAAAQRPVSKAAAIIIVALWISGAALLGWMAFVYWRV
jgi:uncharacterized membrane protein YkvA (DUF1232 family)